MATTSPNSLRDVHCTPLPDLWGPATGANGSTHQPLSKYFAATDKRLSLSSAASTDRLSQLSSPSNTSPPTPTGSAAPGQPLPHKILSRSATSSAIFSSTSKDSIWWSSNNAVPTPGSSAASTPTPSSVGGTHSSNASTLDFGVQDISQAGTVPIPGAGALQQQQQQQQSQQQPQQPQSANPYMSSFFGSNQPATQSSVRYATAPPRGVTLRPSTLDDVLVSPVTSPMVTPIGYNGSQSANSQNGFAMFQPLSASNAPAPAPAPAPLHYNRGLGIEHSHMLQQQQQQHIHHPMLQRHQSLPVHQTLSPQNSHFVHYDIPPIEENGWKRDGISKPAGLSLSPPAGRDDSGSTSTLSSHAGTIASAASSTTSVASAGVKSVPLMSPVSTPTTPAAANQPNGYNNSNHNNSANSTPKRKSSAKPTINTELYKTELCSSFMTSGGNCPYGSKCQFAHGERELKTIDRPPKWRSKPCQNWIKNGSCSYNDRCCFRHDVS